MGIKINLDVIMAQKKIGLLELADKVEITPVDKTGFFQNCFHHFP